MTDFIQAFSDEIESALAEQATAFQIARDRFVLRAHDAEVVLIAAMTHRGRLYVAGPAGAGAGLIAPTSEPLRCGYPNCDCAVSSSEGYKPSEATECPRCADSGETESRAEEASR